MRAASVKKGRPLKTSTKEKHPVPPRASAYTAGRSIPEPTTQQQKIADLPARPITSEPLPPEKKDRFHFLTWFGVGMILAVGLMACWNMVLVPAFQNYQDQLHYGDGRISSIDADVGHGGVSTFLAFDRNGQVTIIELPGGEIDHTRLYQTGNLIGSARNHRVITLEVHNVKGYGKPDVVIYVEGMSQPLILYNNGTGFQWTLPQ